MYELPFGAVCLHPRMDECHPGCGHYSCPDCGLTWDDLSEGHFPDESPPESDPFGGSESWKE